MYSRTLFTYIEGWVWALKFPIDFCFYKNAGKMQKGKILIKSGEKRYSNWWVELKNPNVDVALAPGKLRKDGDQAVGRTEGRDE